MSSTKHQRRRSAIAVIGGLLLTAVTVVATAPQAAFAASTVTQWNFNSTTPDNNTGTGINAPSIGLGTLAVVGGATNPSFNSGVGSSDPAASDNSGYQTTTYPAQGTEDRSRGLQVNASTVGQQDIVVSWDQRHSNTSSRWVQFQYSTDGNTFTDFGAPYEATAGDTFFNGRTADLSSITAVDDNPNFAFRIVAAFAPGTGSYAASSPTGTYGTAGTWRFDMVTVSGDPVGGPTLPTLSVNDVTLAEGNSGTTTFSFTVGLSAASASAVTFDIGTADGTATTTGSDYLATSLTGQTIAAGLTSYTFDVSVNGDTVAEPTESFLVNLTNVAGATLLDGQGTGSITDDDTSTTFIRDIQGAAHRSPLLGQAVAGVPGIVTARVSNGFYLQDPLPDANDATSEAIFVFTSSAPTVTVGASVRVSGTVSEFRPGNNANNLTITQISGPTITVLSNGNPLPAPTVIGAGGRVPPSQVINDEVGNVETAGSFDAATDGIDFYESLEAMLVQIGQPVVVGPTNSFGELWVLADGGAGASLRTDRGGIVIRADDYNPERIQLDDRIASTPTADVGAVLDTVVGVVSYDFNNYEVFITSAATVATPSPLVREVTTLAGDADDLTVATFNVENLDPNDGAAKFTELATAIVTNLGSPDIVGLEEIQDSNGPTNDSVVDAATTFQTLIAAIVAAGGPTYEFRQINPIDDTNGGEPGGNIRVGFLFDPARVTFVDRPGGTSTVATTVSAVGGEPQISASPGLIDPTNPAFNVSRKPLVGEFVFNEQTVFVVVNHWNSKGGDQPLFGPNQPPTLSSEAQRNAQAAVVRDFVQSILTVDADAKVAVIGDLNDFEFSNPVTTLEGAGLTTLIETLPPGQRYTYNFQGNAQSLDHILVSGGLLAALAGYDVVNMNSEFADQISDHDPQVAQFTIAVPNRAPVADGQSVTTDEDTSTPITLVATDPDNDTVSYTVVDGPTNGTLSGTAPNLTYTPNADYNGPDSFTFRANDGTLDSELATVSITVTAANDTPTISYLPATPTCAANGASATFGVTVADIDAGDVLTVSATSTSNRITPSVNGTSVSVAISGNQAVSGTVTVRVTDAGGLNASFTINVIAGNGQGNTLTGTNGIDYIFGLGGSDTLRGLGDSDVLCGGDGTDSLLGGDGDDTLDGGQGTDTVSGEIGNDRLFGGTGTDSLTGGAGVDAFDGGVGTDVATDRVAGETLVNVP